MLMETPAHSAKLNPLLITAGQVPVETVPAQTVPALTSQVPMAVTARAITIGPPVTTRNA